MRIVVVGASGFIGRRFVVAAAAAGHSVVAGVRDPARVRFPSDVTVARIEATDRVSLATALAGADRVVDCVMAAPATMVDAARAISETVIEAGVGRIVEMSSIAVYGATSGLVDEDAPPRASDPYGRAKIECEAIYATAAERGADVVTLRPALVYGPGSSLWVERIARLLMAKRLGDLGAMGDGFCNIIHVDDVVDAMLAAVEREALGYRAYTLAPATPPTWNHYLMRFAKGLGATPVERITTRRMKVERLVLAPILRVGEILARRLGRTDLVPPPITPGLSRLFDARVRYDPARSRELLGADEETGWRAAIDTITASLRRPSSVANSV